MTHTGLLIVAGVDLPIIGEVEAHGSNYVLVVRASVRVFAQHRPLKISLQEVYA